MRRGAITLLVVAALLALAPGLALARNFVGTNGNDRITGTQAEDIIRARGGDDVVDGRGSDDEIFGGSGNDRLRDNTAAVDADEILLLHHGQVRERGTHRDLMALGGLYERLYRLQSASLSTESRSARPSAGPLN